MALFRSPALPSSRRVRLLRPAVALLLAAVTALTLAQRVAAVDPWWIELSRYLPYPAVAAPALVALLLSAGLGWRWRLACVAVLGLVATLTMGLVWSRPAPGPATVRLMTYNVKAIKASQRSGGYDALAREVALQDPDILVMQDAGGLLAGRAGVDGPPGSLFGLGRVVAYDQYLIASRLPMHDCRTGRAADVGYLRCLVDTGGAVPLDLVTVHFESPRTGLNATRRDGLDGTLEWRRNYGERLAQSRALAAGLGAATDATPDGRRGLVIAGDLNAPEASPVVRTLLGLGLRDAFSAGGRGYGFSYGQALRVGFSFLRIDHILVGPGIGVVDCRVGHGGPSEHRPVIADLAPPRS